MPPPRRNPRPTDFLLFFGVLFIAAAIGAKAFWRETVPPPVGIDAPELWLTCRDGQGREWSCGRVAKTRLAELVAQGDVACSPRGRDRYSRTLAVCSARNVPDIGEVMVREGYAVNFAIDYGGYPVAEREAQSARSGIWQGDFDRPKDWRRRHPRIG